MESEQNTRSFLPKAGTVTQMINFTIKQKIMLQMTDICIRRFETLIYKQCAYVVFRHLSFLRELSVVQYCICDSFRNLNLHQKRLQIWNWSDNPELVWRSRTVNNKQHLNVLLSVLLRYQLAGTTLPYMQRVNTKYGVI